MADIRLKGYRVAAPTQGDLCIFKVEPSIYMEWIYMDLGAPASTTPSDFVVTSTCTPATAMRRL